MQFLATPLPQTVSLDNFPSFLRGVGYFPLPPPPYADQHYIKQSGVNVYKVDGGTSVRVRIVLVCAIVQILVLTAGAPEEMSQVGRKIVHGHYSEGVCPGKNVLDSLMLLEM